MGAALDLEPDLPVSKEQYELKELQIERAALIKDRTRLKNRLQIQTLALTGRQTKARLGQVERQIKAIDAEIAARLNKDRQRSLDVLKSILVVRPKRLNPTCSTSSFKRFGPQNHLPNIGFSSGRCFI